MKFSIHIATLICLPVFLFAAPFTAQDSGWVSLFDGTSFEGLYIRIDEKLKNPATQTDFTISDSAIHASGTGGSGFIATKEVFSNYQVRVQFKYNTSETPRNAGLLYHIVNASYSEGQTWETESGGSLMFRFPTCIEFQMYNGGGASGFQGVGPHTAAFLGIGDVWGKSKVNKSSSLSCPYDENGEDYDVIVGGLYCARRVGPVHREALDDVNNWVWVRLDALGDSAAHYIDGVLANRVWDIEFKDNTSPTRGPMTSGHIGLQTESYPISYRHFELRNLGSDGVPVIPGCMDSLAPNYKPFATISDSSCAPIPGCMDTLASNYDSNATVDDSSCIVTMIKGIKTELNSLSFDPHNQVIHYALPVTEQKAVLSFYNTNGALINRQTIHAPVGQINLKSKTEIGTNNLVLVVLQSENTVSYIKCIIASD
ncbi:MAG: DUF1080 domain-containing protein [Fibrobacteria bacterium]|nr:DUF1080 domain-containing protein [Fibrobacteria bacterium]